MRSPRNSQTSKYKLQQAQQSVRSSVLAQLIGIGLLLSGVFTLIQFVFQVKTVICRLDDQSCPIELQQYADQVVGRSMFGVDYSEVLAQQEYPLPTQLSSVKKQLPHQLELAFASQPLEYKLLVGEQVYSVSKTGALFTQTDLPAPITITVSQDFSQLTESEDQLQPSIHTCLHTLAQGLNTPSLKQSQLTWLDKDTITLIMNGEQQTIFLDCENPSTQLHDLQRILTSPEFQEKSADIKEIDMRFELPVLRMQQ